MQHIDEDQLARDPQALYDYLADFIGFGNEDVTHIRFSAPHIGPKIAEIVDKTYEKLLAYDATARHFLPKQSGFEGDSPVDLATLQVDHPQIRFRKDHLNRYLTSLIGRSYNEKMVAYLDMVGKIHTADAGNAEIVVPLVQMNALMGLISDAILEVLANSPMNPDQTRAAIRSFNRLFWIQNAFIARHYAN